MSNTDSFVEEVNEEVRRDRLYALLRRYGWIAVLAILVIVGGAAFSEYRKAQERAQAEALGDAMLAALGVNDTVERAQALAAVTADTPTAAAVLGLMTAAEYTDAGDTATAIEKLDALAVNSDIPFKSITLQGADTPVADRRQALEAMAQPGNPLRLLASEQMALIDIETGDSEAAITRYQSILVDAEVSSDLQQRALQVIVALGGEPELSGVSGLDGDGGAVQSN